MKKNIFIKNFIIVFKYKWQIYIYIFLIQLLSITSIFITTLSPGYLINFLQNNESKNAIYLVIAFVALELLIFSFNKILSSKKNESYEKIKIELYQKLYEKSIEINYQELENTNTLIKLEAARTCIAQGVIESTIDNIINIISSLISFFGLLYLFKEINYIFKIIIILLIIIYSVINIKNSKTEIEEFDDDNVMGRKINYARFWLPEKSFAKEVRSYNLQDYIVNKLDKCNDENYKIMIKYLKKYNKSNLIISILLFIQLLVVYGYTIYLYSINTINLASFITYSVAFFRLISISVNIISMYINIHKSTALLKKFYGFININSDNTNKKADINLKNIAIEFKNVYFKYDNENQYALQNINLKINPYEKIALVGDNGAGKSTLIKLLLRLYKPTSGEILINNININDFDFNEYISLFSTVFQDYTIFNFKIKENICMNNEYDENKIQSILKSLELDKDINLGITNLFNDDGIELSGGEGQKVAIARALYKNSSIIILDEPTSALSPQSEADLYNKLSNIITNKTTIFISHRLASCKMVDTIIVLNNGKIIEKGTHNELINIKDGYYKKMFETQAKMYLNENGDKDEND